MISAERIAALPDDARSLIAERGLATLDGIYAADCWRWLCDQVYTVDEAGSTILPWPAHLGYLRDLLGVIETGSLIAIPKSRRMMATWLLAAYCVWRARYVPSTAIFFQSETEDKAAAVVDRRCAWIEDHLRHELMRRKFDAIRTAKGLIGRMTYASASGGFIWAIPQGADAIRSYTFSLLVMDESEFQEQGTEALVAALPAVEKGAKLILISSSGGPGGVMAGICKEAGFVRFQ